MEDEDCARLLETEPLMSYYPAEAVRQKIEGLVSCRVTVDGEGKVVEAEIILEAPEG